MKRGDPSFQLIVVAFVAAVGHFSRTALGPVQEAVKSAMELSDNQIAIIQGPAIVVFLLLTWSTLGRIIDKYPRPTLLAIWSSASWAGAALSAVSADFVTLLIGRVVVGVSATAIAITCYAILGDTVQPSRRGRASMVVSIGQAGGMAAAFYLGGTLLDLFASTASGWRTTLVVMSVPPLFALLAAILINPQRVERTLPMRDGRRGQFAQMWARRAVVFPLIFGAAIVSLADGAASIWTAPMLARRYGMPPHLIGETMGLALLAAGVVGPSLGGLLSDACQRRGGTRRAVDAAALLATLSAGLALYPFAQTPLTAAIAITAFLTTGMAINLITITVMTLVVPSEIRGTCLTASFVCGMALAYGVAPISVTLLAGHLGDDEPIGSALAIICAGTSGIGAAVIFAARKNFGSETVT